MPTTTRHNIYGVPDDLWLQANIEALRRGIRVGELVGQAIEQYLESGVIKRAASANRRAKEEKS